MAPRNPNESSERPQRMREAGSSDVRGGGLEPSGQAGERIGSPISNEAYNVLAALHAKLEGLEAYRKFSKDGQERVWQQLTERDIESVGVLISELERIVREGRLRLGRPGETAAH